MDDGEPLAAGFAFVGMYESSEIIARCIELSTSKRNGYVSYGLLFGMYLVEPKPG